MTDEVRKVIAPLVQEEMERLQQKKIELLDLERVRAEVDTQKIKAKRACIKKRADALRDFLSSIMPKIRDKLSAEQLETLRELGVLV